MPQSPDSESDGDIGRESDVQPDTLTDEEADKLTDEDADKLTDEEADKVTDEEELPVERSRRVKKPVIKLCYDELGTPSNQTLTVLSHEVLVRSGTDRDSSDDPCRTVWCHPLALCPECFNNSSGQGSKHLI